ncbi:hypothetical protein [Burkholderia perseverans]|uniref:hypothetical protein n=1 Tax=Burkholderia perseverans TaxID=2615214 RepID=UPI001FEFCEDA|nr:hypothetical protein [Burkholderia perseverans]
MNASFENLFIFLLSKLRLPQVYCEPDDDDKSYIARSITLVRHKKRGTAPAEQRLNFSASAFCHIVPLPRKKILPTPRTPQRLWFQCNNRLQDVLENVKKILLVVHGSDTIAR